MRPVPDIAIPFIEKFEGFSPKPYICPAGRITIGFGHTSGVVSNMLMTKEEAEKLLTKDLQKLVDPIINGLGIMMNNNQLSAILSFCYNCGLSAFLDSTLKKKIVANAPVVDILFQFKRWDKVAGVSMPGLTYRRSTEASLYFTKQ